MKARGREYVSILTPTSNNGYENYCKYNPTSNTIRKQIQSLLKLDEKREEMNRGRGFRWEIAGGNVCIPPPSSADINHFHILPAAVTTDKHQEN